MHKVVATRDGFYDKYRRTGEVFTVRQASELSDRWMAEVGTDKHRDFMEARGRDNSPKRDQITGERVRSGGVAEQLAIALEENRRLTNENADLQSQVNALVAKQDQALKPVEDVSAPADEPDDDGPEEVGAPKPTRARRRRVKKD